MSAGSKTWRSPRSHSASLLAAPAPAPAPTPAAPAPAPAPAPGTTAAAAAAAAHAPTARLRKAVSARSSSESVLVELGQKSSTNHGFLENTNRVLFGFIKSKQHKKQTIPGW
jgi:2-oxoglutarate dehydrogenase E2 component (dihydrolipoamide succinyltransferase)